MNDTPTASDKINEVVNPYYSDNREQAYKAGLSDFVLSQARQSTKNHLTNEARLYKAAADGRINDVNKYLERGVNLNAGGIREGTALHASAKAGHVAIVELLLSQGADMTVGCDFGTPLYVAIRAGHIEVVRLFIERGADIEARDLLESTPLHTAICAGHIDIVRLFLERRADIEAHDLLESTPLHTAICAGHIDIVKLLIQRGANIEAHDLLGGTPLHAAICAGHIDIVKLLIQRGADIAARNTFKDTPLYTAVRAGNIDIVRLLIEEQAEFSTFYPHYDTPLTLAVKHGYRDIARLLLSKGSAHYAERAHYLAIREAASKGDSDLIKVLLNYPADITSREIARRAGKHLVRAALHRRRCLVSHLLKECTGISQKSREKATEEAVLRGYRDIVDIIQSGGRYEGYEVKNEYRPWGLDECENEDGDEGEDEDEVEVEDKTMNKDLRVQVLASTKSEQPIYNPESHQEEIGGLSKKDSTAENDLSRLLSEHRLDTSSKSCSLASDSDDNDVWSSHLPSTTDWTGDRHSEFFSNVTESQRQHNPGTSKGLGRPLPSNGSRKRSRDDRYQGGREQDDQGDTDGGDDKGGQNQKTQMHNTDKGNPRKLACHFYKWNMDRWSACGQRGFSDLWKVKVHLIEKHAVIPCFRCKQNFRIFPGEKPIHCAALQQHSMGSCSFSTNLPALDGVQPDVVSSLLQGRRNRGTPKHGWRVIYQAIFNVDEASIPEPYHDQVDHIRTLEWHRQSLEQTLPTRTASDILRIFSDELANIPDIQIRLQDIIRGALGSSHSEYMAHLNCDAGSSISQNAFQANQATSRRPRGAHSESLREISQESSEESSRNLSSEIPSEASHGISQGMTLEVSSGSYRLLQTSEGDSQHIPFDDLDSSIQQPREIIGPINDSEVVRVEASVQSQGSESSGSMPTDLELVETQAQTVLDAFNNAFPDTNSLGSVPDDLFNPTIHDDLLNFDGRETSPQALDNDLVKDPFEFDTCFGSKFFGHRF